MVRLTHTHTYIHTQFPQFDKMWEAIHPIILTGKQSQERRRTFSGSSALGAMGPTIWDHTALDGNPDPTQDQQLQMQQRIRNKLDDFLSFLCSL